MRTTFPEVVERGRTRRGNFWQTDRGQPFGEFVLKAPSGRYLRCLACDGLETRFDHVSVAAMDAEGRSAIVPTWEEMCWVKDLFWGEDECVVQYHPPKSEYVNVHPAVLHLWKPLDVAVPLPPKECV